MFQVLYITLHHSVINAGLHTIENLTSALIAGRKWRDKMPKYINADEMIADENEAYLSAQCKITDKVTRDINFIVHTKLQRLLTDAPAADVEERKTGKWLPVPGHNNILYCSNCTNEVIGRSEPRNFCPNCGAKMEE